jgi:hypothetical protein
MTAPSTNLSASGFRQMRGFRLAINGYPDVTHNSGTLAAGTLIPHVTAFTPEAPSTQPIDFYGSDQNYAQDTLPPTTIGQGTFQTESNDFNVAAFFSGAKVVTSAGGNLKVVAGSTNDKLGSEPRVMLHVFRQALDTDPASATFGERRQWEGRVYGSARVAVQSQDLAQGKAPKNFTFTPTMTRDTAWGVDFSETTWGVTQATHVTTSTNYQPVLVAGVTDGTLASYALPFAPVDANHVDFWVNGTAVTVTSVTGASVTFNAAPALGTLVGIIQCNQTE